jgi:acetyl-CoA C-acetyltransferase/acetyl-CoA acyltransferase
MSKASVVGVGMTKFGPLETTLAELFADAALPALHDSGVDREAVDAFYLGNTLGGMTENETHMAPRLASHIGLRGVPCQRFEDACATSSNAFKHAVQAVETGIHDVVLVGGVERCTTRTGLDTDAMTKVFVSAADRQYEQPTGISFPGMFALLTNRHMHIHGTTEAQLAEIAVKNHSNGRLNPRAHFGKETSVAEVLDSPLVADPFRLMDCCPFSDGAAAVVVANQALAPSFDAPVAVTGLGHGTDIVPLADKERPTATRAARIAAREAYTEAEIGPDDVDFAEVHDCFTGAELLATEALGFFADGEGGPAAATGRTARNGALPVNPSGGLKAKGHPIGATGAAQIVELVEQLRGDAGDHQIPGADVGLAHNLGGDTATTCVTIMEADG